MTRDKILAMPAGPDLDALVAAKVMGWARKGPYLVPLELTARLLEAHQVPDVPCYSTDITAAWRVVEKMKDDGDVFIEWWRDGEWTVARKPLGFRGEGDVISAPTAPLAICRSALLAVEGR